MKNFVTLNSNELKNVKGGEQITNYQGVSPTAGNQAAHNASQVVGFYQGMIKLIQYIW